MNSVNQIYESKYVWKGTHVIRTNKKMTIPMGIPIKKVFRTEKPNPSRINEEN
jgi:hypothetical protein